MSTKEDDKAEREAYIRGAKAALQELAHRTASYYPKGSLVRIFNAFEAEVVRGEWPKEE